MREFLAQAKKALDFASGVIDLMEQKLPPEPEPEPQLEPQPKKKEADATPPPTPTSKGCLKNLFHPSTDHFSGP